jgi:hypothetical protein
VASSHVLVTSTDASTWPSPPVPLIPERVNVIEVWQEAEALKKWRKRAKPPKVDKPKHIEVKRYDATDGASPRPGE